MILIKCIFFYVIKIIEMNLKYNETNEDGKIGNFEILKYNSVD